MGSFPVLPISDTIQTCLPCHQELLKVLALFLESVSFRAWEATKAVLSRASLIGFHHVLGSFPHHQI